MDLDGPNDGFSLYHVLLKFQLYKLLVAECYHVVLSKGPIVSGPSESFILLFS